MVTLYEVVSVIYLHFHVPLTFDERLLVFIVTVFSVSSRAESYFSAEEQSTGSDCDAGSHVPAILPSGNLIVTVLVILTPVLHTSLKGLPTNGLNSAYNLMPSKIHLILYKQSELWYGFNLLHKYSLVLQQ